MKNIAGAANRSKAIKEVFKPDAFLQTIVFAMFISSLPTGSPVKENHMHRYPVELRIVKVNLLLWFSLSHIHTTAKTTENGQPESILGYGAPKWG